MSASDRVYRTLLVLLPAELRREFGDDMVQLFRDQRRARSSRPARLAALWLGAVHDIVTQSIDARRDARRARRAHQQVARSS